jgi:hypothetical protein
MPDILSLVGSAVATAGTIFDFAKTLNNADLSLNIANLKRLLAETQNMVADLLAENRRLQELFSLDQDNPLSFDKTSGFYVDREKVNYCPACYEGQHLRSHLRYESLGGIYPWVCPVCRQNFSEDCLPK